MRRADRFVVAGFVAFTIFVWAQRLVNLARGDESSVMVSLTLSVLLLALAIASALGLLVVATRGWVAPPPLVAMVWRVAAGVTVAVWVVRAAQITLDWRSVGFVVVHVVLAAVSIALAVGTWRAASVSPHSVRGGAA
jgi:hypothetical protein